MGGLLFVSVGMMTLSPRFWIPALLLSVLIPIWVAVTAKFWLPVAAGGVLGVAILLARRGMFGRVSPES